MNDEKRNQRRIDGMRLEDKFSQLKEYAIGSPFYRKIQEDITRDAGLYEQNYGHKFKRVAHHGSQ